MLDDRSWRVLAARQVSLGDRVTAAEPARMFGISPSRLRQAEKQAAQELRDALDDPRFIEVAATAERSREVLGDRPVPIRDARHVVDTVTADGAGRLGQEDFELLLWCAGPYDLVDDTLALRDTPPR